MTRLAITNADIIDGTGNGQYRGTVIVSDGLISDIVMGDVAPIDFPVIDATGFALAPGFIDIHTHADIALLARPDHLAKVSQGVTTEVFTNCGLGFAPASESSLASQKEYLGGLFGPDDGVDWTWRTVAEFLSRYEQRGSACNIVYLVAHGAIRSVVMGMDARSATAEETHKMVDLVHQAREEGAWGLSTGLWYAPMSFADRTENVALCRAAGFFATHQRDYGDQIWEATQESLDIAREADVPVQISHLQMNGPENRGRAGELLAMLDYARASGVDVTCDTYPYTAGSTLMQTLLPTWATDGGPSAILRRLTDEQTLTQIRGEMIGISRDWSLYQLSGATHAANRRFDGVTFPAIAQDRHLSVVDWVLKALVEEDLQACFIHHGAHEGNVQEILQWPHQMVGSDGLHLAGKCHPRLRGTFPRVVGHYVRDTHTLPLTEAVRKMTSLPAERLGLKDRGRIAIGLAADLVLFDPNSIADRATFDEPHLLATGIASVLVNGQLAFEDGSSTGRLAGKVLRPV